MRALSYMGPDALEWREVDDPRLRSDAEAIVRPLAVTSCDLDDLIVRGRSPFPPPFVLGHEVVEIGDAVTGVRPGDRVVVPFQISCGSCAACAAGRTGSCRTVPPASTYGFGAGPEATSWGGFLADHIRVPYADAMLVPVPDGVTAELAAGASDNLADAHRAVAPALTARPGAPVLVVGGAGPGSIGVYAAAQALALGSEHVLYVDEDAGRRAVAERYGAATLDYLPDRLERTFAIAVDASGRPGALAFALRSLGMDGVCTSTAIYFGEAPALPLFEMYVKNTTFHTGRVHARREAPHVLGLLVGGTFDPAPVTTRVVRFAEAADALVAHDHVKLVFVP